MGRTLLLARLALAVAAGALAGWASAEALHLISLRAVSGEGKGEAAPKPAPPFETPPPPAGGRKFDPPPPVSPERRIELGALA